MASEFTNQAPRLHNIQPKDVAYGRIPRIALAAVNGMLSTQAKNLMIYYIVEDNGFSPAAKTVYGYTGLKQPKMSVARKELVEKKFIDFDREKNMITILWDNIMTMGKVALMLAEHEDCDVRATLKGGAFNFEAEFQ